MKIFRIPCKYFYLFTSAGVEDSPGPTPTAGQEDDLSLGLYNFPPLPSSLPTLAHWGAPGPTLGLRDPRPQSALKYFSVQLSVQIRIFRALIIVIFSHFRFID